MEHLDERTLELYHLGAKEVSDQRGEIESHLKECEGCAALYRKIREYYKDVEDLQESLTEDQERAVTVHESFLERRKSNGGVALRQRGVSFPSRAMWFVAQHPVVSSVSFAAVLLAAILFLYPKIKAKDSNIAYARASNEFLIVYNSEGEEIWKKHIGIGFDFKNLVEGDPYHVTLENYVSVVDVDGDGLREVISIYTKTDFKAAWNKVYCYDADGKERWKYEIHRNVTFGKRAYSDDYRFARILVDDFDGNGIPEVIAVAAHSPNFPCVVLQLDARDGSLISEYWHPGYLLTLNEFDLDEDGVKEILLGGVNNAFGLAAMVILDPRRMSGHAPLTAAYVPEGVSPGTERYYLLFPRNELKRVALDKKNWVSSIFIRPGPLLEVDVGEYVEPRTNLGVGYYFDTKLNMVKLVRNDRFEVLHRRLEAEGKIKKKLSEEYYQELIDGIQYWDGEKFVKEPTMNKIFREVAAK